jgi:hypothetical protein
MDRQWALSVPGGLNIENAICHRRSRGELLRGLDRRFLGVLIL